MNRYLPVFMLFLSIECMAQDVLNLSMEEFYKLEKSQQVYKVMTQSGQIDKAREMHRTVCFKEAKTDKDKSKCSCSGDIIDKIDGKILMYDSVISYQSFQAKVAAKNSGNEEEYLRLKNLDSERKSLSKMLDEKCQ